MYPAHDGAGPDAVPTTLCHGPVFISLPSGQLWEWWVSSQQCQAQISMIHGLNMKWKLISCLQFRTCSYIKFFLTAGGWINIKMSSYQYRKSHCGDKTILRPSYLHNGISFTGKMTSLYWIGAHSFFLSILDPWIKLTRFCESGPGHQSAFMLKMSLSLLYFWYKWHLWGKHSGKCDENMFLNNQVALLLDQTFQYNRLYWATHCG